METFYMLAFVASFVVMLTVIGWFLQEQRHVDHLHKKLDSMEDHYERKIDSMKNHYETRLQEMESHYKERLASMEKFFTEKML